MPKLVNIDTQDQKTLVECEPKGLPEELLTQEPDKSFCEQEANKEVNTDWYEDLTDKTSGLGKSNISDPQQTGKITNDPGNSSRKVAYRYTKAIRGCDEAVRDLFKNIEVLDDDGQRHAVPIIWASQEKAVQYILSYNVRKDNSLVVDRIKLPMLAIYSSDIQPDMARYTYHKALSFSNNIRQGKPGSTYKEKYDRDTVWGVSRGVPINITYNLYAWTFFIEDMNAILEQILLRMTPLARISVKGVNWETVVKLSSIGNNLNVEVGDKSQRIIKYQFNLLAETYIPQPIVREKAVLKIKANFFNDTNPELITDVIDRIEIAAEELEKNG